MTENAADGPMLVRLFHKQFELCALKKGEVVVLLSNAQTDRTRVQAAFVAAEMHEAQAFEIGLPNPFDLRRVGYQSPASAPGVMEAAKSADLLVTFTVPNLSPWLAACQKAGTRVLAVTDSTAQLKKLQSPPGLKYAIVHAVDRYKKAKRVRVRTEEGTDFTYTRGRPEDTECVGYYGFAEAPGRFDQWGQGMVRDFPDEGTSEGTIVVKPGDVWILPYARLVESEIRLEIREGFIRKVEGGLDAKAFREWLERNKRSPEDMDPFAVSHLGWGLHPNAHWDDILVRDHGIADLSMGMRCFAGNFLFSTGPGLHRRTLGHIDMPLCDCTVQLDDEMIIDRGKVVDPKMVVAAH